MQRLIALAIEHHRAGRLADAEALYRQVLTSDPQNAEAMRLLGYLAHQAGNTEMAISLLTAAVTLRPDAADGHFYLGNVWRTVGRLDDALACYRRVLVIAPRHAQAHNNLATLLRARGETAEAADHYRAALAARPDFAPAENNLGALALDQGEAAEAEAHFRRALALDPDLYDARRNLPRAVAARGDLAERLTEPVDESDPAARHRRGTLLSIAGRLDQAEAAFAVAASQAPNDVGYLFDWAAEMRHLGRNREALEALGRALALKPDFALAELYRANALRDLGDPAGAMAAVKRAIALAPTLALAHYNLGAMLQETEDMQAAEACYRRVLALDPGLAAAQRNLGTVLIRSDRLGEAADTLAAAVASDPGLADAHADLGNIHRAWGQAEEADAHYRRAVAADPDNLAAHSSLIFNLFSRPDVAPEVILTEHQRWADRFAPSPGTVEHGNDPDPGRRLRVGYVSRDFRSHSVGFLIEPVLAAHDRATVEVVCYADESVADATTARLRGLAERWRVTTGLTDEAVAAMVGEDAIDILVDLGGHTQGARPRLFAHKPAPIQVTYLGYPGTTGLPTMDYRLTDSVADPPGFEPHCCEELVRLDPCFLCYRPMESAPAVSPPPVTEQGSVTFGTMNDLGKLTPEAIAVWSRILTAVVGSRLLVKARSAGDSTAERLLREAFAGHGIAAERIVIRAFIPDRAEHLATYGTVDIALDTFPYNGTATTCEALWMGVPVVTLAGDRHAGRVGASLLSTVGLADLVAEDAEAYVAIVTALAADHDRLAGLRAGMRGRMAASPLLDVPAFTRRLEAAYRDLWRRWCESRAALVAGP